MFFILFTTGSGKSLTFEIAPVLNNEAAQLYTGVTFSGSYAKSGGKKKLVGKGVTAVYHTKYT